MPGGGCWRSEFSVWQRPRNGELGFDRALGITGAQFVDNLLQRGRQRAIGFDMQLNAAAQPRPGQIEHVVDQPPHAQHAGAHELDDRR